MCPGGHAKARQPSSSAIDWSAVDSGRAKARKASVQHMETWIKDTRYALRRLRMAPAFTVATTLTVALGIGATTSIFTLAHAVLLKSLPVANPDALYRVGKEARCCYLAGYSQDK